MNQSPFFCLVEAQDALRDAVKTLVQNEIALEPLK